MTVAPAVGGGLDIELHDIDGKALLGPASLQRASVPLSAPNGC